MIYKVHQNPNTIGKNSSLQYISNEKKNNNQNVKTSNVEYLQNNKNKDLNEERILHYQGQKIDPKKATKMIENLHKKGLVSTTIVLNPENDLGMKKGELLGVEKEMRDYLSTKSDKGVTTFSATHTIAADPSHNHVHIVVVSDKKTINFLHENFKKPTLEWKKKLHEIEERVAKVNGKELSKEAYERQMKRLVSKSKSGTLKRYNFIHQHMSKETGSLSLLQIKKSMDHSVQKGNLSQKGADRFVKEVRGAINTLIKEGIATKKDENHYQIDRVKFIQKYQKILDHHSKKTRIENLKEFHIIQKKIDKLKVKSSTKIKKIKVQNHQIQREFDQFKTFQRSH